MAECPNESWKWREDWARGYSVPNKIGRGVFSWVVGVLMLIVTSAVAGIALLQPHNQKVLPLYLIFIFSAVGFFMIPGGIRTYFDKKKFGTAHFIFDGPCGVLGGRLKGKIELPFKASKSVELRTNIRCKVSTIKRFGEKAHPSIRTLWQKTMKQRVDYTGWHLHLPVDLEIPYDLEATEGSTPGRRVYWELSVEFEEPLGRFGRTYEVPVLRTRESDPARIQEVEDRKIVASLDERGPRSFEISETGRGLSLVFPPCRHASHLLFFLMGLVLLGGGGLLISRVFSYSLGDRGTMIWVLDILFHSVLNGLASAVLIIGGLQLLRMGGFSSFQRVSVFLEAERIRIVRRFAIFEFEKAIRYGEIRRVAIVGGGTMADTTWYDIALDTGRKLGLRIPSCLFDKGEALWVADQIEKRRST